MANGREKMCAVFRKLWRERDIILGRSMGSSALGLSKHCGLSNARKISKRAGSSTAARRVRWAWRSPPVAAPLRAAPAAAARVLVRQAAEHRATLLVATVPEWAHPAVLPKAVPPRPILLKVIQPRVVPAKARAVRAKAVKARAVRARAVRARAVPAPTSANGNSGRCVRKSSYAGEGSLPRIIASGSSRPEFSLGDVVAALEIALRLLPLDFHQVFFLITAHKHSSTASNSTRMPAANEYCRCTR